VQNIAFAKVFVTDKDKAHELLDECESQGMADQFGEETDAFKNVALYFIIYVLAMVTLFSLLNACIFGFEKFWLAL